MKTYDQPALVLPKAARDELMRAAAIEARLPPGASPSRLRALEEVIERVKRRYPSFFKT